MRSQQYMRSQQSGFTLVELVLVIVIIGILAAFAVPRFIDLSSQARASALEGLQGSVKSAASLVHSLSVVDQEETQASASVDVEGGSVVTVYGYPAGTVAAMNAIIQDLASATDFTVTAAAGVVTFQHSSASTPGSCQFTYTQPGAVNTPPSISTVTTSGC